MIKLDAGILRDVAAILRSKSEAAQAMRSQLRSLLARPRAVSIFEIFGSDLPDACFADVCGESRRGDIPRDLEL